MAIRFGRLKINRLWGLVAMALALGLLATWLAITYLKTREQAIQEQLTERAKGGPSIKVIVPTSDLPRGAVLQEGAVAGRDVAADIVYADTLTIDDFEMIKGRPLLRPVRRGRPLMRQDVIDDSPKTFSKSLTKGMRAITVDIDELNSIAQMLKPGDFVDLNLISADPAAPSGQQVFVFLQNVKVIATGARVTTALQQRTPGISDAERETLNRYGNATVEVTPQEAAYIALAQNTGKIRMTLRSPEDKDLAGYGPVTTAQLVGGMQKATGAAAKPLAKVEYIVGGQGGAGAAAPININVPNMPGMSLAPAGAPGVGAPSAAGGVNLTGLPPEAAAALGRAFAQTNPTALSR